MWSKYKVNRRDSFTTTNTRKFCSSTRLQALYLSKNTFLLTPMIPWFKYLHSFVEASQWKNIFLCSSKFIVKKLLFWKLKAIKKWKVYFNASSKTNYAKGFLECIMITLVAKYFQWFIMKPLYNKKFVLLFEKKYYNFQNLFFLLYCNKLWLSVSVWTLLILQLFTTS